MTLHRLLIVFGAYKYILYSREYVIHGSKIYIESGQILLTLELRVKRLRRFDLPSADLAHTMIRVGDSAQVVVVAE